MVGLMRRMREGGSWHVRVSLARTGHWIERLGRVDGMAHPDLKPETIGDLIQVTDTPFGRIAHVARSEEHTSELQSLMRISYAVFCLKKKNQTNNNQYKKT